MFAKAKESEIGQRLGVQYLKAMQPTIPVSYGSDLNFEFHQESMGLLAISGVVWDAGLLMVDYMLKLKSDCPGIIDGCCLDIGCGTGIAGISALLLGSSHVLFTDIDRLPCFEYNIEQLSEALQSQHKFITYLWNEKTLPEEFTLTKIVSDVANKDFTAASATIDKPKVWDTVLCSDLLYEEKSHSLLVSVLRRLSFKRAIFTYKKRHEIPEEKFFDALSAWCTIRVVDRNSISLVNLPRTSLSGLYVVIVEPIV